MSLYSVCPFLGPVLGPVMASFINQSLNWRWTWYFSTIWIFVELLLIVFFVPETYAPKLLKVKAARLRKETGNQNLKSARERQEEAMNISKLKYVVKSTGRPFGESSNAFGRRVSVGIGVTRPSDHVCAYHSCPVEILIKEPMAFLLCLWCAILLGILYAFFSVSLAHTWQPTFLSSSLSVRFSTSSRPSQSSSAAKGSTRARSDSPSSAWVLESSSQPPSTPPISTAST